MKPREKSHRLESEAYRGEVSVSFTACIKDTKRPFLDHQLTDEHIGYLARATSAEGCGVMIYCFMPDHLHTVLTGFSEQADVKRAFELFKQLSGYNLRKDGFSWQKDYFDHVIRKGEDMKSIVFYIGENPIRAGLVESPLDHHGIGSIGFDIEEVLQG